MDTFFLGNRVKKEKLLLKYVYCYGTVPVRSVTHPPTPRLRHSSTLLYVDYFRDPVTWYHRRTEIRRSLPLPKSHESRAYPAQVSIAFPAYPLTKPLLLLTHAFPLPHPSFLHYTHSVSHRNCAIWRSLAIRYTKSRAIHISCE